MCQDLKIFANFALVYGFLCSRPSSSMRCFEYSISCHNISNVRYIWGHWQTSGLRYQALVISGTSGRMKKPAIATGKEMTPSMMNSLDESALTHGTDQETCQTIASLSSLLFLPDGTQQPSDIQRTWCPTLNWYGIYNFVSQARLSDYEKSRS